MDTAQALIDLRRISCSGELLSDFVEEFSHSSHVRDIQTEKYLITNHHMVSSWGLQSVRDVIGLTKYDVWLDDTAQNKKDLSQTTILNHRKNVQLDDKIENQVLSTECPISIQRVILSNEGNVNFTNVIKIGVQNHEHKIIAFWSIFLNLTHQVPLPRLFKVYQEFYSKKEAVQKFLNHFNIEGYFDSIEPPTCKETEVLIAMRDNSRCKAVANVLGCSVVTASNHICNIRSKLRSCTLHDVLHKLPVIPENEQSVYTYI